MNAADGVAMMFGIHGGEEVGGGFVAWFFLQAAPMDAKAVVEAAKHSDHAHGFGFTDSTKVIQVGDVESLMQARFDPPGGAIVFEPLGGGELIGRQAGDQSHDFRFMVAQVATQQGDLLHTGKIHRLGGGSRGTQHAYFQSAFVDFTFSDQRVRGLPRGKNPPEERSLIFQCWLERWVGCP